MHHKAKIYQLFLGALFLMMTNLSLPAQDLPVIRISVENTASHVQTRSVQRFADLLSDRLEGRYTVRFFPAASLYRDADVFRALVQGKLEIAVPGTWQFDRYVPEVSLFLLPSLYGRDASVTYGLMESSVGQRVVDSIEKTMDVKVLGRWIDLGYTHLFSTSNPIKRPGDMVGKRIRVAGGRGNELRITALGGDPLTIAWPEFPNSLRNGKVDAVLTSYETVASAKLWELGIRSVYEDRQYFAQYVPISSGLFWDRLPPEVQEIVLQSWESIVDQARREASVAQAVSRSLMVSNGVSITLAGTEQIRQTRGKLISEEADMVRQLGITSDIYALFTDYMKGIDSPATGDVR